MYSSPLADRPARVGPIPLAPPSVEDAQVQASVGEHLHAAGAARLHSPPGRVEPHVRSLHEVARHHEVVVLDEDRAATELLALAEAHHCLHHLLAFAVARMGLAREDDLHRPLRVEQDPLQPLQVGQDQVGALVGGEAAGEADGESAGVEHAAGTLDVTARGPPLLELTGQALPGEDDQALAPPLVGRPQLLVGDAVHPFPGLDLAGAAPPVGAEVAVEEPRHLPRDAAPGVGAVGDVPHRHFRLGERGRELAQQRA